MVAKKRTRKMERHEDVLRVTGAQVEGFSRVLRIYTTLLKTRPTVAF